VAMDRRPTGTCFFAVHPFFFFTALSFSYLLIAISQGPPSPTWRRPPARSIPPTANTVSVVVANEPPEAKTGTNCTTTIANLPDRRTPEKPPTRATGAVSPCDDGKDNSPSFSSSPAHCETTAYYEGSCDLWCPEDEEYLSPLHCFLRKYCVEAVTAKVSDISTPKSGRSPGRTVSIDQVWALHKCIYIVNCIVNSHTHTLRTTFFPFRPHPLLWITGWHSVQMVQASQVQGTRRRSSVLSVDHH
jgi:hypothetical protein